MKEIIDLEDEFMVIQKDKYFERLEDDKKRSQSAHKERIACKTVMPKILIGELIDKRNRSVRPNNNFNYIQFKKIMEFKPLAIPKIKIQNN